jgi:hypothetical protein
MENTITHLNVSLTTSYGHYVITGIVNGELVKANTTNSMAYDWYNDDEDLEKMEEAIAYCHRRLFDAYEYQETN